MKYPVIDEAQLGGRKVFLRVDLNVPMKDGHIADDTRIRAVLPTLRYIIENGASVIITSHMGRPGGKWNPDLTLAPVAERLGELLGRTVFFAPDCIGARVTTMVAALKPGDLLLLENLRFHSEEKKSDMTFAARLASLADIYVNDAFGTSHREHASLKGVPEILGGGYVGFLIKKELEILHDLLSSPAKPFALLLGGSKVSDKIPVIENLLPKLDHLLIGGAMAFTFMKAEGLEIGNSLVELDRLGAATKILKDARDIGIDIHLPVDIVVSPSSGRPELATTVSAEQMPRDQAGLDIGHRTVEEFGEIISRSCTIVWNGPMGVFEISPFDTGTREVAAIIAEATKNGTLSFVGGGDSVRAVVEADLADQISFLSTGGGASLQVLQGTKLKSLEALGGSDS